MRFLIFIPLFSLLFACSKENVNFNHSEIIYYSDIQTASNGDTIYSIYIANAFSPNGDGINDLFQPRGYGIKNIKLEILSSSELIYSNNANSNKIGWNGLDSKNKPVAHGTYFYKIETIDEIEGKKRIYEGQCLLFR